MSNDQVDQEGDYGGEFDEWHDDTRVHDDGHAPLALAAGLAAALVAGAAWAIVVRISNAELGIVAWGVGLLVGTAMARVTTNRSRQLAYAAAGFAVLGLLVGKIAIFAGSTAAIAAQLSDDHQTLAGAVAWHMYAARELEDSTLAGVDATLAANDTLSDALWGAMTAQAGRRVERATAAERKALAEDAARSFTANMGIVNGVLAQLSLFDALWLLLAVGTAYKMMTPQQEHAVVAEDNDELPGA